MDKTTELIRHLLATLAYRFQKVVRDAPDDFGNFDPGAGVRTPSEIVRHMTHVLLSMQSALINGDVADPPPLNWSAETQRLHHVLEKIDDQLKNAKTYQPDPGNTFERLLQGQLSDVMTHIGQLAMLRRLAGSPVTGENFRLAEITLGRVGQRQAEPVKPESKED